MAQNKQIRDRTVNWGVNETEVLKESCLKHNYVLNSAFGTNVTAKKKAEVWGEICTKVNAVGGLNRSVEQVKKKWKNIKCTAVSSVRQYSSYLKGTGNFTHYK